MQPMDKNVIAYYIEVVDSDNKLVAPMYIRPQDLPTAKKIYGQEGFTVQETPLTELPEGVTVRPEGVDLDN